MFLNAKVWSSKAKKRFQVVILITFYHQSASLAGIRIMFSAIVRFNISSTYSPLRASLSIQFTYSPNCIFASQLFKTNISSTYGILNPVYHKSIWNFDQVTKYTIDHEAYASTRNFACIIQDYSHRRKIISYPTFVDCPIDTEGPTTVPDPMRTSDPSTESECTTAPTSTTAVGSMRADLWKRPPPLFHLTNADVSLTICSSDSTTVDREQKEKSREMAEQISRRRTGEIRGSIWNVAKTGTVEGELNQSASASWEETDRHGSKASNQRRDVDRAA